MASDSTAQLHEQVQTSCQYYSQLAGWPHPAASHRAHSHDGFSCTRSQAASGPKPADDGGNARHCSHTLQRPTACSTKRHFQAAMHALRQVMRAAATCAAHEGQVRILQQRSASIAAFLLPINAAPASSRVCRLCRRIWLLIAAHAVCRSHKLLHCGLHAEGGFVLWVRRCHPHHLHALGHFRLLQKARREGGRCCLCRVQVQAHSYCCHAMDLTCGNPFVEVWAAGQQVLTGH